MHIFFLRVEKGDGETNIPLQKMITRVFIPTGFFNLLLFFYRYATVNKSTLNSEMVARPMGADDFD
jgi:hypothetical protein